MKILFFSPEYPPLQIGGLARHVHPLAEALAKEGHAITVITQMAAGVQEKEIKNGVEIIRVNPLFINATDFSSTILQINFEMVQAAGQLILKGEKFDLIHGHDWLVAMAARTLKHILKIPLVMTIHATEHGRNHGIHNNLQRYINDLEWLSCYEAWRVIVCSQYMNREIQYLFQVPKDKIDILHNGVTVKSLTDVSETFRQNYAHPNEKIVFFVGRLVQEKGLGVLLRAIPEVLGQYPETKFVIAGKGPQEGELKYLAKQLGIADSCYFTGFVDDQTRDNLYRVSDLAVFPSMYEPFGIVALEAMAAKVPVLVTDVGGLSEIVDNLVDGIKVIPGSAHELAKGILRVIKNPKFAQKIQQAGYEKARDLFDWSDIAQKTIQVYTKIRAEYLTSPWFSESVPPQLTPSNEELNDLVSYRYQTVGR